MTFSILVVRIRIFSGQYPLCENCCASSGKKRDAASISTKYFDRSSGVTFVGLPNMMISSFFSSSPEWIVQISKIKFQKFSLLF